MTTATPFVIVEMAVAPRLQRQGLGRRLLGAIEDELREEGVARVEVLTAKDKGPRRFYHKNGYRLSRDLGDGQVILARKLTSGGTHAGH